MNKHIQELVCSLFKHCRSTLGHSLRVADELHKFSSFIDIKPSAEIYYMGAVHDIGKLKISSSLLNKTGKLTISEKHELNMHAFYGKQILQEKKVFSEEFMNIILYHHENLDGSGYYGLKGQEIPLFSRMLRLIDSYDAMLYGRAYQFPINEEQIKLEIEALKTTIFDAELVCSFLHFIEAKKQRMLVEKLQLSR